MLATEATALVHGRAAADAAAEHRAPAPSRKARSPKTCRRSKSRSAEMESLGVLAAFVRPASSTSNGEARRQIKGGGLKVNDSTVTDEKMVLTPAT